MQPQPPPSGLAERALEWINQNLLLIGYFMLILFGAVFARIFRITSDELPLGKSLFAMFFSCILAALAVGYISDNYVFNKYLMLALAAFLGMGADRMSHWALSIWQQSSGPKDFLKRITDLIFFIQRAVNSGDSPKDAGDKPPTAPPRS